MKPRNTEKEKKVSNRIMFGKYAGKLWSEVPTEYLEWFVNNGYGQMKNRKLRARVELIIRSGAKLPLNPPKIKSLTAARDLIAAGFKIKI